MTVSPDKRACSIIAVRLIVEQIYEAGSRSSAFHGLASRFITFEAVITGRLFLEPSDTSLVCTRNQWNARLCAGSSPFRPAKVSPTFYRRTWNNSFRFLDCAHVSITTLNDGSVNNNDDDNRNSDGNKKEAPAISDFPSSFLFGLTEKLGGGRKMSRHRLLHNACARYDR